MGRRRQPAAAMWFKYVPGPPKRVRVFLRSAEGVLTVDSLSTREARAAAGLLLQAVDTAEADKIALRGDATQKKRTPKRDGSRGMTKKSAVKRPTRAKRVESAALNLHSILQDLVGAEGAEVALVSQSDLSAGLLCSALQELSEALGPKAAARISKPKAGGPSL